MSVRPVPFAGRLGGATLQPEALATSSRSAGLGRRLAAANIVCSAGMQDAGGPGAGGPGRSSNPGGNAPVFKVPSGKELERMRQFRQQQQYRQQQKIRQLQRDGPRRPPGPPPPVTAPTLQPRGRAGQQPTPSSEPRVDSPGPSKRKPARRSPSTEPNDGLDPALWRRLVDQCGLEASWRAQVGLLAQLGLRPADFARLAEQRPEVFQTSVGTMRRKLAFLRDHVGLSTSDLHKVVAKFPRILEYSCEQTLRPRIAFLCEECGVPLSEIARLVVRAPMIMALSMDDTLRPRVAFLRTELRLPEGSLGKLVGRHPQVLTCSEDMMASRIEFLLGECGLSRAEVARAVLAHPQVLHYKIDSMRQRLDYLHSVGMSAEQAGGAVARLPQIFSLNVSGNMAPKWHYLVEHLGGGVAALCAYPGYFSLSLNNRIVPRHRFLARERGGDAPMPFPLSYLKMADKKYAEEVVGSTLAEFEAFKEALGQEAADGSSSEEDEEEEQAGSVGRASSDDEEREWAARLHSRQVMPARNAGVPTGIPGLHGARGGALSLGTSMHLRQLPVARSSPE